MVGIYRIESPTGRNYIGQSCNIEKRFSQYRTISSVKPQKKLYYSFIKYGIEKHKFNIICECKLEDLEKTERHYIRIFNSVKSGLNITNGGKKLYGENNPFYGKNHSKETKEKISVINKGNESFKGHFHSDKTKSILREYRINQTFSEEAILKMKNAWLGKKHKPETLIKMSQAHSGVNNAMYGKEPWNKGKKVLLSGEKHPMYGKVHPAKGKKRNPFSEETKRKMSQSAKERCNRIGPPCIKKKADPNYNLD